MSTVYINYHPNYDYAMAIIDGFVDVREYVRSTEWLCWAPSPRGNRQIMISRVRGLPEGEHCPERVEEFVKYVSKLGADVLARNEREDSWQGWVEFKDKIEYNGTATTTDQVGLMSEG